jgi:hypothetical protein
MPYTYAIADLHGRYDLLSEAVAKIIEHSKVSRPATIIALGDYIDRGPKSRQIIERLMDWKSDDLLGPRAGRKTRARSTFKNHRENEPDMTTYPLDFHRRSEQKWVLRAQASSARKGSARDAVVGSRSVKRGQRRSGQPERRDILARTPWLMELGQWPRAEYNATDQRIPERLAALLEELSSSRPPDPTTATATPFIA